MRRASVMCDIYLEACWLARSRKPEQEAEEQEAEEAETVTGRTPQVQIIISVDSHPHC